MTWPDLTAERMRRLNKALFWLWVCPGLPVSYLLRQSVAWVVLLSVYSIVVGHLIAWRQET